MGPRLIVSGGGASHSLAPATAGPWGSRAQVKGEGLVTDSGAEWDPVSEPESVQHSQAQAMDDMCTMEGSIMSAQLQRASTLPHTVEEACRQPIVVPPLQDLAAQKVGGPHGERVCVAHTAAIAPLPSATSLGAVWAPTAGTAPAHQPTYSPEICIPASNPAVEVAAHPSQPQQQSVAIGPPLMPPQPTPITAALPAGLERVMCISGQEAWERTAVPWACRSPEASQSLMCTAGQGYGCNTCSGVGPHQGGSQTTARMNASDRMPNRNSGVGDSSSIEDSSSWSFASRCIQRVALSIDSALAFAKQGESSGALALHVAWAAQERARDLQAELQSAVQQAHNARSIPTMPKAPAQPFAFDLAAKQCLCMPTSSMPAPAQQLRELQAQAMDAADQALSASSLLGGPSSSNVPELQAVREALLYVSKELDVAARMARAGYHAQLELLARWQPGSGPASYPIAQDDE
jgi:hypothetical protein